MFFIATELWCKESTRILIDAVEENQSLTWLWNLLLNIQTGEIEAHLENITLPKLNNKQALSCEGILYLWSLQEFKIYGKW